jgi:GNAT superfamily N-acetyltransferase
MNLAEMRALILEASKEKRFKRFTLYASASPGRNEWNIEAYLGKFERKAGVAEFVGVYEYGHDEDNPNESKLVALKGWNVEVHPDFRRQGLASAMYEFASEAFKLKVQPGDFQTPSGGAFLKREAVEDPAAFVAGLYKRHPKLKSFTPKVIGKTSGGSSSHPEARQSGSEVWLFPKFWDLDPKTRDWVFAHELGHFVQGERASGTEFLDRAKEQGIDPWDTTNLPYGQFNMDEAFADCFAAYHLEPAELRRRYPRWEKLVIAILS